MARLVKTAAGTFKVRYYDGSLTESGKPRQRASRTFRVKADALEELRAIEKEGRARKEARRARPGRPVSLAAILKLWSKHVLATRIAKPAYATDTVATLTRIFKAERWTEIRHVASPAVIAWRAKRDGTGTDRPLSQLKALLRYAATTLKQRVDLDVLAVPGRRGKRRRVQPPLLTAEQVAALIARATERGGQDAGAIVEHLATYGCRPIDACRLEVRDFNATAGELTLRDTKNGETVTHPLLPRHVELYRTLVAQRRPGDALFRNPHGEAWRLTKSAQQLTDWYGSNVSEHLLPRAQWGIYLLKDYAITTMDDNGIEDRTKMLFTGHRDPRAYEPYKSTNAKRANAALGKLPGAQVAQPVADRAP